jgi:hypothetical protein
MRNALPVAALSALVLSFLAGAAPSVGLGQMPDSAIGTGSMNFGHEGEGIGFFDFHVQADGALTGSVLFAGEHHEHYPDIIIRLDAVHEAEFKLRSVTFTGKGAYHEQPVIVEVTATDGRDGPRPDHFAIECTDGAGGLVFEAEGYLNTGDILVGEED